MEENLHCLLREPASRSSLHHESFDKEMKRTQEANLQCADSVVHLQRVSGSRRKASREVSSYFIIAMDVEYSLLDEKERLE